MVRAYHASTWGIRMGPQCQVYWFMVHHVSYLLYFLKEAIQWHKGSSFMHEKKRQEMEHLMLK